MRTQRRYHHHRNGRLRRLRAIWRDTLLLVREFIRPLSVFALAIIGGGVLYFQLARFFGEEVGGNNLVEATYQVLGLTFFAATGAIICPIICLYSCFILSCPSLASPFWPRA